MVRGNFRKLRAEVPIDRVGEDRLPILPDIADDVIALVDFKRAVLQLPPGLQRAVIDMLHRHPVVDRADEQRRRRARKELRRLMSGFHLQKRPS